MSLVMLPIKENEQPPLDISISSEDQEDTSWIDCSEELSKNCFSQFGELRKSGHLTDVIIKVEGREISAHKIILASTIPFFNAMFTCEMIEAHSNVITLPSLFFFLYFFKYLWRVFLSDSWTKGRNHGSISRSFMRSVRQNCGVLNANLVQIFFIFQRCMFFSAP
ncbi:unnamed protein product [Meloidogyne enterolobii]|uniref:Uncharacterized protein n=1 Tax=Meloidogyne enterolobii TaxID=390850 RepID=A0ACB0Y7N9_MELEN